MKTLLLLLALSCAGCRHAQPKFDLPKEVFVHVDPRDCKLADKIHNVWNCKNAQLMPQTVKGK
jgi:hypothetical protein